MKYRWLHKRFPTAALLPCAVTAALTPEVLAGQTYSGDYGHYSVAGTNSWVIGHTGTGTWEITNEMRQSTGSPDLGINGIVGNQSASNGTATIGTGGWWRLSGKAHIGYSGTGTLNITDGGLLTTGSSINIGRNGGSTGYVNITDGGEALINGGIIFGHNGAGVGTLNVSGTDSIINTQSYSSWVENTSTATFNVDEGGYIRTQVLNIHGNATFNLTPQASSSTWLTPMIEVGHLFGLNLNGNDDWGELNVDLTSSLLNNISNGDRILLIESRGNSHGSFSNYSEGDIVAHHNGLDLKLTYNADPDLTKWGTSSTYDSIGLEVVTAGYTASICNNQTDVFMSNGKFYIGNTADGCWTLTSGTYTNTDGFIGVGVGVTGTATVDGASTVWQNNGTLTVGVNGTGNLVIKNGGTVQANSFVFNDDPDWQSGTLIVNGGTITGTGKLNGFDINSSTGLVIGSASGQTLILQNGATHTSTSLFIGRLVGDNGTLKIDGSGSSLNAGTGSASIGEKDIGALTISNGGSLTSGQSYVGSRFIGGTGSVTVDGSGSLWDTAGTLWIGDKDTGSVTASNGGDVEANKLYVGGFGGSDTGTGSLEIDGSGSTVTTNQLTVGSNGAATIDITNGGELNTSNGVWLGGYATGNAVMTINGTGSVWNHLSTSPQTTVINQIDTAANGGKGALVQITNGGAFNSGLVVIGNNAGRRGTVEVDGAGSQWNTTRAITVSNQGEGTLAITNGGAVDLGNLHIGMNASGNGQVTVDGSASSLTTTILEIGRYGTGSIEITNGADVQATSYAMLGRWNNVAASATVTGAGSTLTSDGGIDVGYSGNATMEVSNGATVSANGTFKIGASGTLLGDGTVTDTGLATLNFTNAGELKPGDSTDSLGILTVDANFTQTSTGDLLIDLGGTTMGTGYDSLDVSGSVSLNGDLMLSFINSFTLSAGDSFKILDADSSISGTFTGLAEGATVGTYNSNDLFITYQGGTDGYDVVLYTATGPILIPEPSSLALLAIGGLCLQRRRRPAA